MIVRAGTERFVFPLSNIVETMQLDPKTVETLPGNRQILQLRGEIAPLLKLRDLLGIRAIGTEPNVVIVETESVPRLAIAVDEIVGQQQVVVKNLEASFRRVEGVSAATILGDGLVALILDVDALPGSFPAAFAGKPSPRPPQPLHESRIMSTLDTTTRRRRRSRSRSSPSGSTTAPSASTSAPSARSRAGSPRRRCRTPPGTCSASSTCAARSSRSTTCAAGSASARRASRGPRVVIVVDLGERFAGILVDAVSDIVDVTPSDMRDAPDVAGEGDGVLNGLVVKGEAWLRCSTSPGRSCAKRAPTVSLTCERVVRCRSSTASNASIMTNE